jgi:hypothetical protein
MLKPASYYPSIYCPASQCVPALVLEMFVLRIANTADIVHALQGQVGIPPSPTVHAMLQAG